MRVVLVLAILLVTSARLEAALPLQISFQSGFTYACNGVGSHSMTAAARKGASAANIVWEAAIASAGGYSGRSYMDFFWWDWDVSGLPNATTTSVPAGYSGSMGDCETSFADVTYYLRWRINVASAILAHSVLSPPSGLPDGDTQMKYFIWGRDSGEGRDRMILMFHAGNATGNSGACGGAEATQTCLEVCAGVSSSCARTLFTNAEWVHVQIGWRWGQGTGTAFQRLYVNNNTEGSPTAQNTTFTDVECPGQVPPHSAPWWCFPGNTSLGGQFNVGDIDNTGSAVREDANIESMDWILATTFDPTWYPGATPSTPIRLRRPEFALLAAGLLPIGWRLRRRP